MDARQKERLAELRRRWSVKRRTQKGAELLPDWSLRFNEACGLRPAAADFLGLEETDLFHQEFYKRVGDQMSAFRGFWPRDRFDGVRLFFHAIAMSAGEVPVFLLNADYQVLGALRVTAGVVLAHPSEIWDVVRYDLAFATRDLDGGVCLERSDYDAKGRFLHQGFYVLTCWGVFIPKEQA